MFRAILGKKAVAMTRVMRPAISAYVAFWVIFGFPALLLAFNYARFGIDFEAFILICGVLLFVTIWLRRYMITIDGENLTYRSLFGGTRTIQRAQIGKVAFLTGLHSFKDRFRPWLRVEIKPKDDPRLIVINCKVLRRDDLAFLKKYLLEATV